WQLRWRPISERNLRPQFKDVRIDGELLAIAEGADVVRLQLQVLAEVPVHAQRPVVLAAAHDAAAVQVDRAVARREFHGAPRSRWNDVADVAALVRPGLARRDPAREGIPAVD